MNKEIIQNVTLYVNTNTEGAIGKNTQRAFCVVPCKLDVYWFVATRSDVYCRKVSSCYVWNGYVMASRIVLS